MKRAGGGVRRAPMADLRAMLLDGRVWAAIGVVKLFDGETSHYELDSEDVLVDVELQPRGEKALCRLGVGGGGVWRIPPVGTEVAVLVPSGELDADPVIVATLASGSVPEELDEETLVVVGPKVKVVATGDVEVKAGGNVILGDGTPLTALQGVVNGEAIDTFTGSTQYVLGNTSGIVKAKK